MKKAAIIPAFNEYTKLSAVLESTAQYVDDIIVVDDGSGRPLADHLPRRSTLHILRHRINLGKGAAMKTGVHYALDQGYELVVFIDADGQHNPAEIPSLCRPIEDNQADIVFGVRRFHQRMPLVARLGNMFLTASLRFLFRVNVVDTQSGFRALRLSAYPQVAWESPRYAVETEMIVNVGKHRVRHAEVPIQTIYLDAYKGTTMIDGIRIFLNMLTWRFL